MIGKNLNEIKVLKIEENQITKKCKCVLKFLAHGGDGVVASTPSTILPD